MKSSLREKVDNILTRNNIILSNQTDSKAIFRLRGIGRWGGVLIYSMLKERGMANSSWFECGNIEGLVKELPDHL
jgi:hypothetical protein